jgi:hypothetical protein
MKCPDSEVLERYRREELPPAEVAEINSHLKQCGVCSFLMDRLDAFDEAVSAPGQAPSQTRSPAEQELDRRMEQFLALQRPAPEPGRSKTRWWGWAALGYGLALLLVYPAWLGLHRWTESPVEPAVLVDLNVPRDQTNVPVIEPGPGRVGLSFQVPAKPGDRWTASIADERGAVIVPTTPLVITDGKGDLVLVCPRSLFPTGEYRLTASGPGQNERVVFAFRSL